MGTRAVIKTTEHVYYTQYDGDPTCVFDVLFAKEFDPEGAGWEEFTQEELPTDIEWLYDVDSHGHIDIHTKVDGQLVHFIEGVVVPWVV